MQIGEKGLELIKHYEGLKLEAYLCPANKWTIGYGSTYYEDRSLVKRGDKIPKERAEQLLAGVVKGFVAGVLASVKAPVTQDQFDALVSLAYNIGLSNFKSSTLLKLLNSGAPRADIAAQFHRWNRGGGKVQPGLITRRQSEYELFMTGKLVKR